MARSFTQTEKDNIRSKLIDECEKSWATYGYKKTSIDELCSKVGISKGAFYAFFESKEHLFCRVLDVLQERHKALGDSSPQIQPKRIFVICSSKYILNTIKQISLSSETIQILLAF